MTNSLIQGNFKSSHFQIIASGNLRGFFELHFDCHQQQFIIDRFGQIFIATESLALDDVLLTRQDGPDEARL